MTNSDYIAIATAAIAVFALFSTGWQAWIAHRHSRLSVKPLITGRISHSLGPDGIVVVVALSNNGLGPGIVTGRHLAWQGERFTSLPTEQHTLDQLVTKHFPKEWDCQVVSRMIPSIGDVILQGDTVPIARLLIRNKSLLDAPHLDWKLAELGVVLGYKDLYDNQSVIWTTGNITRRLPRPRR